MNQQLGHRRVVAALFLLIGASGIFATPHNEIPGVDYVRTSLYYGLDEPLVDATVVVRQADSIDEWPLYQRLSLARFLVERVGDPSRSPLDHYERQPGEHDLSRVAGRAALMVERAIPIAIPTITPEMSQERLREVAASARRQYEAYRAGVLDTVAAYNIGSETEAIATRYREAIYVDIEPEQRRHGFWEAGRPQFEQMLHDFFPLGKRLTNLEAVMGAMAEAHEPELKARTSSAGATGVFEYSYHDKSIRFRTSYYFLVEDGVINAVSVNSF
jgi:hypothetical protein